MKKKVEEILLDLLRELTQDLENEELQNPTLSTKLFGAKGVLDSLALVSFIADVEDAIDEAFDAEIILADEKAMSQKTSPFRSVETLRDYILELLHG